MNNNITLMDLVARLDMDVSMLNKHPENKEILNERIKDTIILILICVMENKDNEILGRLRLSTDAQK